MKCVRRHANKPLSLTMKMPHTSECEYPADLSGSPHDTGGVQSRQEAFSCPNVTVSVFLATPQRQC